MPLMGKAQHWRWSKLIGLGLALLTLGYLYALYQYASAPFAEDPSAASAAQDSMKLELEPFLSDLKVQQQDLDQLWQLEHQEQQELREQRSQLAEQQDLHQQYQQQEQEAQQHVQYQKRTLRFQVCNGFGNQRLAILYAAILAKGTGRALVLPRLIGVGTQRSFAENCGTEGEYVDFSAVYDVVTFKRSSAQMSLRVLADSEALPPSDYKPVQLMPFQTNTIEHLERENGQDPHIAIDCALFKLFPVDSSHEGFSWGILDGLTPSVDMLSVISTAAKALEGSSEGLGQGEHSLGWGLGRSKDFNVLHLRFEDDWIAHCRRWEDLKDGFVRNNCYNNTETVGDFMQLVGVRTDLPLYVAAHWPDVDPQRNATIMAHLAASGFKVVTSFALMPKVAEALGHAVTFPRDTMAFIDYSLALLSNKFIGNSVSTFSALALLERRHRKRWSIYYNDGNIPLTFPLPALHKLPWVFTYNSWSPLYDAMLKVAVKSSINHGGLIGYCLFLGNSHSSIYRWLEAHGITMVRHEPKWSTQMIQAARTFMQHNQVHSHLYKNPDMLISTFQRMDLPLVEEISQYNYVLFTDADVFFKRLITIDDFGLPLPEALSMAYELRSTMYPLNAGVMLMHVPYLRRTYDDFLEFVLSNKQGMHFGVHGPVDQGAYNQYYQPATKSRQLHQRFNAKVYNTFQPEGAIVHFHGPKPRDFLTYIEKGTCNGFFWLCEYGWLGSLCDYWPDWDSIYSQVSTEDEQMGVRSSTANETGNMSSRILDACRYIQTAELGPMWAGKELATPTLIQIHKKKWITEHVTRRDTE